MVTAFADAIRMDSRIKQLAEGFKHEIKIISLEADLKHGKNIAEALNSHKPGLAIALAFFDYILPGQEAVGVGAELSHKKGLTIIILPYYNPNSYGDEEAYFGKFIVGTDEPREVVMDYIVISPESSRMTLKKNYTTEGRLNLDNADDFNEALDKLEKLLG